MLFLEIKEKLLQYFFVTYFCIQISGKVTNYMHTIEPFYRWRKYYISENDFNSPFFGRKYSQTECSNTIYNYYIHPQWDEFGSETLYLKILFVDYNLAFAVFELMGEWNDTLYNDIMYFKRDVLDFLIKKGINKFILIGENVLNFHSSDDSYYEEWFQDIEPGWIVGLNFRDFVIKEFLNAGIGSYILFNMENEEFNWRIYSPVQVFQKLDSFFNKRLGY